MDTDDSASLSFLFVLRRDDRLKAVSFRNAIPEVAAFSFCNRVDTKRKSEEYSWVAPLIFDLDVMHHPETPKPENSGW